MEDLEKTLETEDNEIINPDKIKLTKKQINAAFNGSRDNDINNTVIFYGTIAIYALSAYILLKYMN